MSKDYPWGKGTIKAISDVTANDVDKTYTVPAGKCAALDCISVILTTTATAANRKILIQITDGTNIVYDFEFGTQAASLTNYYFIYPGGYYLTTGTIRFAPVPPFKLPAGYTVRVVESMAVDPAADDMSVHVFVAEYDV